MSLCSVPSHEEGHIQAGCLLQGERYSHYSHGEPPTTTCSISPPPFLPLLTLVSPWILALCGGKEHVTLLYLLDACMGAAVIPGLFSSTYTRVHGLGIICCQHVRHLMPLACWSAHVFLLVDVLALMATGAMLPAAWELVNSKLASACVTIWLCNTAMRIGHGSDESRHMSDQDICCAKLSVHHLTYFLLEHQANICIHSETECSKAYIRLVFQ